MRVCFLQLFDLSTPKTSNCDPTSRNYFTRKIFKIWAPSFLSQNSTFLKFLKPIWLRIPWRLWPYKFFPDILILRGQNHENITRKIFARHQIAIWGLRSAQIKNMKKTDPPFFQKKCGSVFFNFLIQALLRPQIAIRQRAHISLVIFSKFEPLQIKISDNNYWGHNPLGIVNHIGF